MCTHFCVGWLLPHGFRNLFSMCLFALGKAQKMLSGKARIYSVWFSRICVNKRLFVILLSTSCSMLIKQCRLVCRSRLGGTVCNDVTFSSRPISSQAERPSYSIKIQTCALNHRSDWRWIDWSIVQLTKYW